MVSTSASATSKVEAIFNWKSPVSIPHARGTIGRDPIEKPRDQTMKIAQITNFYRSGFGGEVTVFNFLVDILRKRGNEVVSYTRDSSEISSARQKALAFMAGIYSPKERRRMLKFLTDERPDVVHVHNLYPLISP